MSTLITKRNFGTDPEYPIISHVASKYNYNNTNKERLPYIIPPISLAVDHGVEYVLNKNGKKQFLNDKYLGLNYSFIEDGAALELNISPTNNSITFWKVLSMARESARNFIRRIDWNLSLENYTVGFFDLEKFWNNRDESFRECVIFGCDPDKIPYIYKNLKLIDIDNNEVIDATNHDLRYFGGHLHVQNMSDDIDLYLKLFDYVAVVFDFLVGLTNVSLNRDNLQLKQELLRLKYYGHPGRARIQNYSDNVTGYEYRPLSNFWLKSSDNVTRILTAANLAGNIIENSFSKEFFNKFEAKIPEMYNANLTLDRDIAKPLLKEVYTWLFSQGIMDISDAGVFGGYNGD